MLTRQDARNRVVGVQPGVGPGDHFGLWPNDSKGGRCPEIAGCGPGVSRS
jgi:hypothetical protein